MDRVEYLELKVKHLEKINDNLRDHIRINIEAEKKTVNVMSGIFAFIITVNIAVIIAALIN